MPPQELDPVAVSSPEEPAEIIVNGRHPDILDSEEEVEAENERRRLRSRSRDASTDEEGTEDQAGASDSRWVTALASQLRAGARIELTENQTQRIENEVPADWLGAAESSPVTELDTEEVPQSSEPRLPSPAADAAQEAADEDPVFTELSGEEGDWGALCETCGLHECPCPPGSCQCPRCKSREPRPVVEEIVATPLLSAQEVVTILHVGFGTGCNPVV